MEELISRIVPGGPVKSKTRTIEVYVDVGLCGCKRTSRFKVESDATDEEIDEIDEIAKGDVAEILKYSENK